LLTLALSDAKPLRNVLCLGAHGDDIEIGCSGTILTLVAQRRLERVTWVVFSATEERRAEALRSAERLLAEVPKPEVVVNAFQDGFFPYTGGRIKEYFEELKAAGNPDLVLTHWREDRHQDHRLIAELTWNTFRDHLILEYEVPKYDGDFGTPNLYCELTEPVVAEKIDNLLNSFPSQRARRWFSDEVFRAVLRLRGMESNAASRYAEGFYARKVLVG
jgi:LmbE family N-acetylglucosaminyl deacetylase